MTRELLITVRGDHLTVECPQKDKRIECANVAGFTTDTNKVITLGQTLAEVAAELAPEDREQRMEKIRFVPIFSVETMDTDAAICGLQYYAGVTDAQTIFFHLLFPTICRIDFPGYENLAPHIRRSFEVSLQFSTDFNELWINGQRVSYPLWRDPAARLLNFVMTFPWIISIFLALPFAFAVGADVSWGSRLAFASGSFLIILVGAAGSTACEWLWVVLMCRFLPRPLIRLMRGTKEGYILFPKRFRALIDRMLADEHSPPTAGSI